jgi:hypothetical protein
VSRRKQRAGEAGREPGRTAAGGGRRRAAGGSAPERDAGARPRDLAGRASAARWGLAVQILFVVAVFALAVLVAELAGAANLGVSFGVGQIAFAIAVAYLLIRR